jgi:hypothetical protein
MSDGREGRAQIDSDYFAFAHGLKKLDECLGFGAGS